MVRCSEIYDNLTLAVGGHTISVFEEKVVSKRFLLEKPLFLSGSHNYWLMILEFIK